MRTGGWARVGAAMLLIAALTPPAATAVPHFTNVGAAAGVDVPHGYATRIPSSFQMVAGGVAAGDFDGDGRVDLFVVCGAAGPARLFRNRGDGTFEDVASRAGVAFLDSTATGPLFFDADGDGWLDLFVGALPGGAPRLLRNVAGDHFQDVSAASGLTVMASAMGASAGDYDGDGRLDLFVAHWESPRGDSHLWRNLGGMQFAPADSAAGLATVWPLPIDLTFTGNFTHVNDDALIDLLVTSDFGTSRVLLQQPGGRFVDATGPEITDQNGMGAAIGDVDGDGRLDWFVSSVWDPDGVAEGNWGVTGSRLYRNRGNGGFTDVTDHAGVRRGYWGWGATFADFDDDGHLDLIHVNGFPRGAPEFRADSTRLFVSNGDDTFTESAAAAGLVDTAQGRGVVAFDFDGDGDLDVFVANNGARASLWRNDSPGVNGWLDVALHGHAPNPFGIGARVRVTAGGLTQVREVRAGTNYLSQDPAVAHFGLFGVHAVTKLRIDWPDGVVTQANDLAADRVLHVAEDTPLGVSEPGPWAATALHAAPNPFTAAVRFELPATISRAGVVRVFDVHGRVVRTLAFARGERAVTWDGADDRGRPAGAGLYWAVAPGARAVRLARVR